MHRRARLLIICAGVALGAALLLATVKRFAQPAQVEAPASASSSDLFAAKFTDAQGSMQPLEQWHNQVIIVNFWATWCPPCRDEMPELSTLQDKYGARGVVVLGISTDDAAKVQQFSRESPVSYPLLAGGSQAMDLAATLGNDRDVLPYTVILRRDGSVAASHFGRIDSRALESALSPLL